MTSLADVAAHAGVSVATASRVLSNSAHPVSDEARARVVLAAQQLNYEYNMLARGLVAKRTRTVGVILHDILDEYFALIARGIEDVAYAAGYTTFVCNTDRDPEKEVNYVRKLRSMGADAVLFTAGALVEPDHQERLTAQLDKIEAAGRVVVRLAPANGTRPDVYYSSHDAIAQMVGHLHDLGHDRLLYVGGPPWIATAGERLRAVLDVTQELGLPPPEVVESDFSREGGRRVAPVVAEQVRAGTTAIMATNDQTALGLLGGLGELGIAVPGDASLAGFGDIWACRSVNPALTTVRLPLYELGARGMEYALALLEGESPEPGAVLPTELVVRASTAPPQGAARAPRHNLV